MAEQGRTVMVLSGGASRGAAQIGMLRALLERDIVPDHLVGTSVGALNAAFVSCDPTPARVDELHEGWRGLSGGTIFPGGTFTRVRHLMRRRPYLYDNANLASLIDDWVPFERVEDLPTPVRIVTSELGSGLPSYHDSGALRDVLLASTALPAVFPPVRLSSPLTGEESIHVDGGITDNVPLAGAVDLEPTTVYVLNVSPPVRARAPRNPIDVLIMSLGASMRLRPVVDLGPQTRVVQLTFPELDVPMTDFTQTDTLVEAGQEAAAAVLDAVAAEPAEVPRLRLLPGLRRRSREQVA